MVWPVAAGSLPRQRLVTSAGTVRSSSGQRELKGSALSLVYPAESVGGCAGLLDGKGNSVNTPFRTTLPAARKRCVPRASSLSAQYARGTRTVVGFDGGAGVCTTTGVGAGGMVVQAVSGMADKAINAASLSVLIFCSLQCFMQMNVRTWTKLLHCLVTSACRQ